ncbi:hypothetical protein KOW79_015920 [Hemibagrus wyckioides]|uniref:Uncharacterized protein n=1 Tax=Hemibagrus wyckioides TaxID=337641 RepID=A0A9D3ND91_9TELE|nr:hypothetical protein KOW79_015920 [Hemibagrus wyckioides]
MKPRAARRYAVEVEELKGTTSETTESLQNQARHYTTLQEMYKTKAIPKKKDIIIMDELCRILDRGNSHFIPDLKTCQGTIYEKAQFDGVFKKDRKAPQDKVKHSLAMIKALPDMFPSPVAPPKKLGHASEAMFHVLEGRQVVLILKVTPLS